jgi:hypothetical protein
VGRGKDHCIHQEDGGQESGAVTIGRGRESRDPRLEPRSCHAIMACTGEGRRVAGGDEKLATVVNDL